MRRYEIQIQPRAWIDIDGWPERDARRVVARIQRLADNLAGDVKRLRKFRPSYRLRVGDWRVLFDVVGLRVIVFRVRNRRDAYD